MFDRLPSKSPFYKWRGIATWPETEATVYSCEWEPDQENGGGWYDIVFTYRAAGEIQKGKFRNFGPETASPYFRGDTFTLRYNPRKPHKFYYPNERCSSSGLWFVLSAIAVGGLGVLIVVSLFR